ncbi:interferon alpha/beta receptor 1 isoform X2 [Ambystoma mexicanum]|uniref:interferon alpha/beta receptor 1 isoform X2 n=1 Tax=Ambystoma mexicanum TaxID=8296 RepID=UPI0037E9801E
MEPPVCCCCCRRSLPLLAALLLLGTPWRSPVCHGAGTGALPEPQDVRVHIKEPAFTVTWKWHGNSTANNANDFNVTFSGYYKRYKKENKERWKELSGCQKVSVTKCDFSPELNFLDKYDFRVGATRGKVSSKWSKPFTFVPSAIAELGPPAVQIESIDDFINLNISAPEHLKNPIWDESDFKYDIIMWKKDSSEQPTRKHVCSSDTIDGLALNTTYCLKVAALLITHQKKGSFGPVSCIHTPQTILKPQPENVRIHALNSKFILKWDWNFSYDKNLSFTVEYVWKQCLQSSAKTVNWSSLPDCTDIVITECRLLSEIYFWGDYWFRVRASNGTGPAVLSKKIKFNASKDTEIGPPSNINVNVSDGILQIKMAPPGEPENQSMTEYYTLSYNVVLWKNSSKWETMNKSGEQTFFTFPDLDPLTLYCLKVQAIAKEENKTGQFSAVHCIKTAAGNPSVWKTIAVGVYTALGGCSILAVLFFVSYYLKKWIGYVFFPSCTLPSNIKECMQDHHMNKAYLVYAEEYTERCCVTQRIATTERDEADGNRERNPSKQSSRDSGNYSNEDETGVLL